MAEAGAEDPLIPLAARIRGGDVGAFEQLFRALHAPLCEVVDSYVLSQQVAEEIVQDLFMAVWVDRDRVPQPRSIRGYLFASARNRALQHLRHRSVARKWAERVRVDPGSHTNAPPRTPDRALEMDEVSRAVRVAVDQLPPRSRVAFVLRWDYEMSNEQIATAMGISIKGVEKLLATAKGKLRDLLGPHAPIGTPNELER
jgi:RNA polymerase sigma-70 factor (ECF subfamily)